MPQQQPLVLVMTESPTFSLLYAGMCVALRYHVDLVNTQLAGMYTGYLAARAEAEAAPGGKLLLDAPLTARDLLLMNIGGDLEDLDGVGTCNVSSTDAEAAAMGVTPEFDPGHCSALVRLTPGNADVFVAQDTWSSLNSMLRIYKLYDFPFRLSSNEDDVAATVPATVFSNLILLDSDLAATVILTIHPLYTSAVYAARTCEGKFRG